MISYYDIRHAKNAMRHLQGKVLRRRKLDIHYSIPKDNPSEKDQNQGTLVIFNLDPSTSNDELKVVFGLFGEIKEIRETPNKKHHKFIEFYDVRDADKAMKSLNKTEIKGKKIKIEPSRPGGSRKTVLNNQSGIYSADQLAEEEEIANIINGINSNSLGGPTNITNNNNNNNANANVMNSIASDLQNSKSINNNNNVNANVTSPSSQASLQQHQGQVQGSVHHMSSQPQVQPLQPHFPLQFTITHSSSASSLPQLPLSLIRSDSQGSMGSLESPRSPHLSQQYSPHRNNPSTSGSLSSLPIQQSIAKNPSAPTIIMTAHAHGRKPSSNPLQKSFSTNSTPRVDATSPRSNNDSHNTSPYVSGNVSPSLWANSSVFSTSNSSGISTYSISPMTSRRQSFSTLPLLNTGEYSEISPRSNYMSSSSSTEVTPRGDRDRASASASASASSTVTGENVRRRNSDFDDKSRYILNMLRVRSGEEQRTTLMIKNIPNKYSQKMLLSAVDERHRGGYDFFYLPIDFKVI